MNNRKQQILQAAVDKIATEGYAKLTMRALARTCNIKLGALQYHFPTWEALLRSLADYIRSQYHASFPAAAPSTAAPDLRDIVGFLLDDAPGEHLHGDRLWPQLWAMAQVEPVIEHVLQEIYANYLLTLERSLVACGSKTPRAEALSLMSLIEGSTLFTGRGAGWESDAKTLRSYVLEVIDTNYPQRADVQRLKHG